MTGSHHAHALHSPYWWLKCAVGVDKDNAAIRAGDWASSVPSWCTFDMRVGVLPTQMWLYHVGPQWAKRAKP